MLASIAIYPEYINDKYITRIKEYVKLAKQYGFTEVFTSIHLPEFDFSLQVSCLEIISKTCKENDMELTVDVGGSFINKLLSESYISKIKNVSIDFIRLDYGSNLDQIKKLYQQLDIKGFVVNASIYDKNELEKIYLDFKLIDNNIQIRGCHNFYVREETGLDLLFAYKQDEFFRKYNLPVYYCLQSKSSPRGPLYLGLCTIEKHRHSSISKSLTELYLNNEINAFMMADCWLEEEELKEVKDTLNSLRQPLDKVVKIPVCLYHGVSEQEKNIVLRKHRFRYDSPNNLLRSQSSRQMAEFATEVQSNNCFERKEGTITIDNNLYKRYSGELMVVTENLPMDERVNCVAYIKDDKDMIKLLRFKEGYEYVFVLQE